MMFGKLLSLVGASLTIFSTLSSAYPTIPALVPRTDPDTCSWILEPITGTSFIIGKKDLGSNVAIALSGDNLIVTYLPVANYLFTEAHLYLSTAIPTGTAPGKYPYTTGNGACKIENAGESVTCTVPYSAVAGESVDKVCCTLNEVYYIATHAALVPKPDSGITAGESGWGNGPCITSKCAPWAMYWSFSIPCKAPPPPPPPTPIPTKCRSTSDDTAYGWNNNAIAVTENSWAFYHKATAAGLAASPIGGALYAGAGKGDVAKGYQIGTWSVGIFGTTLKVEYRIVGDFELDQTHFDIRKPLLTGRLPPGQSFMIHEPVENVLIDTYEIPVNGDLKDKEGTVIKAYLFDVPNAEFYMTLHAKIYKMVPCQAQPA